MKLLTTLSRLGRILLLCWSVSSAWAGSPAPYGETTDDPPARKTVSQYDPPAGTRKAAALNATLTRRLNQALGQLSLPQGLTSPAAGTVQSLSAPAQGARIAAEANASADTARAYFSQLDSDNRYFEPESLTGQELLQLPVGLRYDTGDNTSIELALVRGTLHEEYAELSVFLRVKFPGYEGQPVELFMGADKLRFSYEGGILEGRLVLLGDVDVPMQNMTLRFHGALDRASGAFQDLTFAEFGCSEFKGVFVDADLIFDRSILVPFDPATGSAINGQVKGRVKTFVRNFNDLFIGIFMPPFAITGFERIGYLIDAATFDFSDRQNPYGIVLPQKSRQALPNPDSVNSWRGVYLKEFRIMLPPEFRKRNDPERITARHEKQGGLSVGGREIIIDRSGFSGEVYAQNVYSLSQGTASGWSMSLQEIRLAFESNQLIGGGIRGKIALPVSSNEDTTRVLGYTGLIQRGGNYLLSVQTVQSVDFALFKARATLAPNSAVTLVVKENRFRPVAVLNGSMGIYTNAQGADHYKEDTANAPIKFKGIVFKEMVLRSEAPFLTIRYLGYENTTTMGNYPVSIGNFGVSTTSDGSAGRLSMSTDISLMEGGRIGAKGAFALRFKLENKEDEDNRRWAFDGVDWEALAVRGSVGPLTFSGAVQRYDEDPQFGTGFLGCLTMNVKTADKSKTKFSVNVLGQFGMAPEGYRYWSAEALVQLGGEGVPLIPKVLFMNGFGGGAYHHMEPQVGGGAAPLCPTALSGSSSPVHYVPSLQTKLGFKAVVTLTGAQNNFNGMAGFEMIFNEHWGVSSAGLFGEGRIAADKLAENAMLTSISNKLQSIVSVEQIDSVQPPKIDLFGREISVPGLSAEDLKRKANMNFGFNPNSPQNANQISFDLALLMDFENDVFHGDANVFVNLPKAGLQGVGARGRAGWLSMHFAPDVWYIFAGQPQNPLGVQLSVGSLAAARAKCYLMAGQNLPGPALPPARVMQIVGTDAATFNSKRSPALLEGGQGFALGLSFEAGWEVNVGLRAELYLGTGFDIMMLKTEAPCPRNEDGRLGNNGWYATGRVYMAIFGSVGLRIGFVRVNAVSISLGALALAELPKPTHFYGKVNAEVKVLTFKVRIPITIDVGKSCS